VRFVVGVVAVARLRVATPLVVTGATTLGVVADVAIGDGAAIAAAAGDGTAAEATVGVSAPVPAAVVPGVKPGVVFVGVASDGFAATARDVALDKPLTTFAAGLVLPVATAAVDGVRPVPAALLTAAGVDTAAVVAPVAATAATPVSAKTAASPSAPVVTIGVGAELLLEFAVICGFATSAGGFR
jgi:hypothetical protein